MIDQTASSFTTAAFEEIAEIQNNTTTENAEAIAQYRADLLPILIDANHPTRVLHMLQTALHAEWALNKAADSWLTIEELSWGTYIPKQEVTESLLDLAFRPGIKLSRRRVDGIYRYSLENGTGY